MYVLNATQSSVTKQRYWKALTLDHLNGVYVGLG